MDEAKSVAAQNDVSSSQSCPTTPTQESSSASQVLRHGNGVQGQAFVNPTLNIIHGLSRKPSLSALSAPSREGTPPPLPPRPQHILLNVRPSSSHAATPTRPNLVSKATIQLSLSNTQSHPRDHSSSGVLTSQSNPCTGANNQKECDADDSASTLSYVPASETGLDVESILGEVMEQREKSQQEQVLLKSLGHGFVAAEAQGIFPRDPHFEEAFGREFDEISETEPDGSNEAAIVHQWRAKLKHFLILSSAGKPIYSRHGDDQLITNHVGVIQTIISFYESTQDDLKGFTAGDVRFVVMSKGPLNLVAITRLPESDTQLRAQLEALYMQILSTLTLPSMERMFAARSNYDLRRPLQGTETLLSALADGFTRGSPATLLSALECLKLRKSRRTVIHNSLLKTRSENLLYGLVVASGKLVSVVRPKKHSLHPGDLHLIFNMLFEAGSVKAGGGENWIPLCLPGFNNTGYLYMYVSFLNFTHPTEQTSERPRTSEGTGDEVAVLLISAEKEGFFSLRAMKNELVENLHRNGSIEAIKTALKQGRPTCTDVVPGSPLRHFLYKSRGNVQFTMPSYAPYFCDPMDRRFLLNLYGKLHASLHGRPTALKVHHETNTTNIALAWSTPLFELYCVAPGDTSRAALVHSANKIIQWVRREEERVFIIGGAVF